jgi:hypothetical protein
MLYGILHRERIGNSIFRRILFENGLMADFQPGVTLEEALVLFSHAEDYTGWHSM